MFHNIAIVKMIPHCDPRSVCQHQQHWLLLVVHPWLALGPLDLNLFALGFEEGEGVAGTSTKKFMTQECLGTNS